MAGGRGAAPPPHGYVCRRQSRARCGSRRSGLVPSSPCVRASCRRSALGPRADHASAVSCRPRYLMQVGSTFGQFRPNRRLWQLVTRQPAEGRRVLCARPAVLTAEPSSSAGTKPSPQTPCGAKTGAAVPLYADDLLSPLRGGSITVAAGLPRRRLGVLVAHPRRDCDRIVPGFRKEHEPLSHRTGALR